MGFKFHTIGQIEHERVPFIDAVTTANTYNGALGDIEDGKFTVGATKTKGIMQVECGDDEAMPKYPIAKGTHVRVIDFAKCKDNYVEIYDYPLPDTVAVGDKLESAADGSLTVNSGATGVYFEVTEIIGNHQGVVALITDGE